MSEHAAPTLTQELQARATAAIQAGQLGQAYAEVKAILDADDEWNHPMQALLEEWRQRIGMLNTVARG
jgi:hypothetical protein